MLFKYLLFELLLNFIFFTKWDLMMAFSVIREHFLSGLFNIFSWAFFRKSSSWFFYIQMIDFLHFFKQINSTNRSLNILI